MEQDQQPKNEISDDDFAEVMSESSELSSPVTSSRAERFYDRMRDRIRKFLDDKGTVAGKAGEYLLLEGRLVILGLVKDRGVTEEQGGVAADWYFLPLDITPSLIGPIGTRDSSSAAAEAHVADTDAEVLRRTGAAARNPANTNRFGAARRGGERAGGTVH